jgi:competence protein ComEA
MSSSDTRALSRVAGVLLLASVVRYGVALRQAPLNLANHDAVPLPGLLEESQAARREDSLRSRPLGPGEKIDPNRATATELDRLPGVGPSVAAALIRERESEGAFTSEEDLTRVPGIGAATVNRLRPHLDLTNVPSISARRRRPSGGAAAAVLEGAATRLDLNLASPGELEGLPGIGPALAARIVELRRLRGSFRSVDDLLAVRGIGPVTLERLRPRVLVRGSRR